MRRMIVWCVMLVFGIGFCATGCEPDVGTGGDAGTTGVTVVGETPPCCAVEGEDSDDVATEHDAEEAAAAEEATDTAAAPSDEQAAEQPAEESAAE
ncbi:MAG: hypothetical protein D6741_21795 [Planctomycetota bacterium]|nr:MAG: hypothetical protein D6741_21795 [Planctomycetota bacterium]